VSVPAPGWGSFNSLMAWLPLSSPGCYLLDRWILLRFLGQLWQPDHLRRPLSYKRVIFSSIPQWGVYSRPLNLCYPKLVTFGGKRRLPLRLTCAVVGRSCSKRSPPLHVSAANNTHNARSIYAREALSSVEFEIRWPKVCKSCSPISPALKISPEATLPPFR
jgi:hypothetical protein